MSLSLLLWSAAKRGYHAFGANWARCFGVEVGARCAVSTAGKFRIWRGATVRLGAGTTISPGYRIQVEPGAVLEIGENVFIGEGLRLTARPGAKITIGSDCRLNHSVSMTAHQAIEIGDTCLLGPYSFISDNNHVTMRSAPIKQQGFNTEPVVLGRDVWLGVGATLLKGSSVGEGGVIAARSVVTKPVPCYEIWAGIPAKRIGERTDTTPDATIGV